MKTLVRQFQATRKSQQLSKILIGFTVTIGLIGLFVVATMIAIAAISVG